MIRAFLLLLALSAQLSVLTHAGTEKKCARVSKAVIATTHVPPLVEVRGEVIEGNALKAIERRLDPKLDYHVKALPWARALRNTQLGEVDGLFPVLKSQSRMKDLLFVEPALGQIVVSLFNKEGRVEREPSEGAIVATLRSFDYDQNMLPGAVFTEVNSFAQAIEMLNVGRVDYILGVKEIISAYISESDIRDIVLFQDLGQRPIYLTLSKKSDNFLNIKHCLSISGAI